MRSQNIIGMFKENCIDTMRTDEIIRLGLNVVPTIIIVSQANQAKGIYEKDKAFKYIEELLANRRSFGTSSAESTRKLIQSNNIKQNIKDGLYEYQKMESEGFSDAYSYFNNDQAKELDLSQPKSFLPHGKDKDYGIITIPESKTEIIKNKIKKVEQEKMMKSIMSMRNTQDNQLKDIMNREQIECVINSQSNI
jgi:hypothetical protein